MNEQLSRLINVNPAVIKMGLGKMHNFLEEIGNPQLKIPPVIHVAGTNGKGSTIAFIRSVLEQSGLKCHVYTSPHLVRFNERITIAGENITDDYLLDLISRLEDASKRHNLTFFEATTALAFLAFSENQADYTLLETGLGGRLDATNVIGKPTLTVITQIDYDHMEYLGDSLAAIASEKAGIIKPSVPCICAPQVAEARDVIAQAAAQKQAPVIFSEVYDGEISLAGNHQKINAGIALAALQALNDKRISDNHIVDGIANAMWQGRLQKINLDHINIYLDGAHNPAGASSIADFARNLPGKNFLICAMMRDKDQAGFLSHFRGLFTGCIATEVSEQPRSLSSSELADIMRSTIGGEILQLPNVSGAIRHLKDNTNQECNVIICGSLFLVGETLEIINSL